MQRMSTVSKLFPFHPFAIADVQQIRLKLKCDKNVCEYTAHARKTGSTFATLILGSVRFVS